MTFKPPRLVLASKSQARADLLRAAGLDIEPVPADIDERAAEAPLLAEGFGAEDIAAVLADAKALDVSARQPGALVIGADQTLDCEGTRHHKPASQEEARAQLLALQGRTHTLHTAVTLARDGASLFAHQGVAHLTMRSLTPKEIGTYMADMGDLALQSVGAYQIEGRGIRLMERIDGDHATILGLPLLPLLAALRAQGALDY